MRRSEEEATKLTAGALNTLGTSMISIGVLGPLAAYLYAPASVTLSRSTFELAVTFLLWAAIGVMLHWCARRLLRKLDT